MSNVVFTQGAVQTAYVSYLSLNITLNSITLLWSWSNINVPYTDPSTGIHYQTLANSMDVTTGVANTNYIVLPDATQSAVGYNFIITNVGASSFELRASDGITVIATITDPVSTPNANSFYVQLVDTSTPVGTWTVKNFGVGTASANANALAGFGLKAIGTTLNTQVPVLRTNTPIVPPLDGTYRASLIVWTGGMTTFTLPLAANVPPDTLPGYAVSFNNQGSATLTLDGNGTFIDGELTKDVEIGQSLTVISDGIEWTSLGLGQHEFTLTSKLNKNVATGSPTITLTPLEASSLVQEYFGALANDVLIYFPPVVSYWFINNITSNDHTLTVQLAGGLGSSFVIPQGTTQIFYSDGVSMVVLPTALQLADGSAALPAISFLNDPITGIFRDSTTDTINISIGGFKTFQFLGGPVAGALTIYPPDPTVPLTLLSTNTGSSIGVNAIDAISIDLAGAVTLPAAPLDIPSGGTGATTQPLAINALMPPTVDPGEMVYWDGTDWSIFPAGTVNGQVLTWNSALSKPEWV